MSSSSTPSPNLMLPAGISMPKSLIGPLLITTLLIGAHLSFGILDGYQKLLLAVITSIVMENLLHKYTKGSLKGISSAYVSGISAGILIRSAYYWPFALTAMISIASKYVLRYKGRHLWNPTNFGVSIMMLIAADSAAVLSIQWGNQMWAMIVIWLVGIFTLMKVGRFNITGTYLAAFVFFAWVRTFFTGDAFLTEVAPLTGPMYQLFALFMMTDPKTTVKNPRAQTVVVVIIAFVEMVLRLAEVVYAPFYALFIVGPIALIIEDWWNNRNLQNLGTEAVPKN